MAVGVIGQQAHGGADVPDQNAGDVSPLLIGALAHIGKGPALYGVGQILSLESRALAEKEGAWNHLLGVAGDQFHRALQNGGKRRVAGQQAVLKKKLIVIAQRKAGSLHIGHHPCRFGICIS